MPLICSITIGTHLHNDNGGITVNFFGNYDVKMIHITNTLEFFFQPWHNIFCFSLSNRSASISSSVIICDWSFEKFPYYGGVISLQSRGKIIWLITAKYLQTKLWVVSAVCIARPDRFLDWYATVTTQDCDNGFYVKRSFSRGRQLEDLEIVAHSNFFTLRNSGPRIWLAM